MHSFYIAMGQGIIANADVEFFTEALYSCTFIAGCDASRTRAGAFHFPAGEFRSVRPVLDQWLVALNPAEVTLVFANPDVYLHMGTPETDQIGLQHWLTHTYGIVPATTTASSAAARLAGGHFYAGTTRGSLLWDPEVTRDVTAAEPGQHARYRLFDARGRMDEAAPAVVQEASSGRRKRRRSWVRRHGCIVM